MKKNIDSVVALNDLICINNERYACYKKAAEEMTDADTDLKGLFNQYAVDSRIYANKLQAMCVAVALEQEEDIFSEGTIYLEWKNELPALNVKDRSGIISVFNKIERITQSAYESLMKYSRDFSDNVLDMLEDQQFELNETIKKLNAKERILQSL